jgi:hypothetical protein
MMRSREVQLGSRTLPAVLQLLMWREMHAKHHHPGYQQRLRDLRPKAQAQIAEHISSKHPGPCRLDSVQP